jgi:hypothetical protein
VVNEILKRRGDGDHILCSGGGLSQQLGLCLFLGLAEEPAIGKEQHYGASHRAEKSGLFAWLIKPNELPEETRCESPSHAEQDGQQKTLRFIAARLEQLRDDAHREADQDCGENVPGRIVQP